MRNGPGASKVVSSTCSGGGVNLFASEAIPASSYSALLQMPSCWGSVANNIMSKAGPKRHMAMLRQSAGSVLYISLLKPYWKAMQNDPGASKAASYRLPHQILRKKKNKCKRALEPLRQFPLHFLLKSLFNSVAKRPWSLQGRFLYISLLNAYSKAMPNGPGASAEQFCIIALEAPVPFCIAFLIEIE